MGLHRCRSLAIHQVAELYIPYRPESEKRTCTGRPSPTKLAAILGAEVASHSILTDEDKGATHRTLGEYLDLMVRSIESHRGQVMPYSGDAVLAKFDFVVVHPGRCYSTISCFVLSTSARTSAVSRSGTLNESSAAVR